MKTYLLLSVFICTMLGVNAQNATKSTIAFNHIKGLNVNHQKVLDSVYHNMSDLNYHYFNLVSKEEMAFHQQPKLLKLIKARATKVMDYYKENQQVEIENLFLKYGGQYPTLWLHKPESYLTASGKIMLDDSDRQCFSFNPTIDNMITSENGNRFYFPPNAFETLDGVTIVNEDISICIWEFMDKKSLVYSGLTTDANGKMLETAGSFYIEAKLFDEELRLIKGEDYTVEMQSDKSFPDMYTYYGGNKDGIIDWTVNPNERSAFVSNNNLSAYELDEEVNIQIQETNYDEYGDAINSDSEQQTVWDAPFNEYEGEPVNFYELSAGKLGWINCDRFYEAKKTTTLAVRVDTEAEMIVRIVFKDINSVMPCYSNSNHYDQYEASGIPTGEKVLLLAYSVVDDNAVLGYKEITIGENKIENISLNNLSKTRFKSAVSELLSF